MIFLVPVLTLVVLLLATWKWGGLRDAAVHDEAEVRALLAAEHPEWRPTIITPSIDARGALACAPPDESVAVVFAHGDTLASRLLHAGDVASIDTSDADASLQARPTASPTAASMRLRLHLHDFGCPHLDLALDRGAWESWRPRLQRLVGALVLALAAVTGAADAQAPSCVAPATVTFEPTHPRPGTLVVVRLADWRGATPPAGSVAGEPLHFRSTASGAWRSLAAVPIDARTLPLRLACPPGTSTGASDTASIAIPLAAASYPLEKLRVAPEFSAKPDSALQARLDREAERAAAVSRISHDTPPLWSAPFRAPRDSRITSTFGRGREFNGTVTSRHMGTDYAGSVGAPIRAANRGVVRIVDRFYLGGNVVYLDHGDGLVTAYLHMSEHRVAVGDTVEQGTVIGLVGATGRVTGPHLHWIARYGRVSVDPASLLRATGGASADSTTKRSTKAESKRRPKAATKTRKKGEAAARAPAPTRPQPDSARGAR